MKRHLILLFLIAMPSILFAQGKTPQFKDYPAEAPYKGKNTPVKLTKDNRDFRTRLRETSKGKPSFAGRYMVGIWGCGTSCLSGAIVDAKTGKVYWLPGIICCWEGGDDNFSPVEYKLNSRLMILSGLINENDKQSGLDSHFYEFKNGRFVYVKTIKRKSKI